MTDLKENILKSDSNNSFVLISNDNKKSNEANPEPEFDISSVQALVIDPISEIMRLRKENENLKNKVETLNIKLNLKNEELVLKNNIIDELRNIEIKKLEKIIDELQIENARLSSIISDLERKVEKQQLQLDLQQTEIESLKADNKLIKASKESQQTEIESLKADNKLIKASKESQQTKLDKLVEDMEAMKLEKQKLEEASLISDIYHQLYKQFLLKNKDDDDIKKYIKVKTNESNKTSLKVYLAEFHAIMRDRNDISARIKSKFNNAINKNSSANLLSHENNSNIYSKICEPRNIACHSSIRDSSNFDSKKDYLQQIKSRIEIMQHHKTDGEQLFKQLQNIIDDEAAESESDRNNMSAKLT